MKKLPKKKKMIGFRVTEAEARVISAEARKHGMHTSGYVRINLLRQLGVIK